MLEHSFYLLIGTFIVTYTHVLYGLQDLKALLNESLDGKAILNTYATTELLEDDDRDSLTDIVMKWVLLRNTK